MSDESVTIGSLVRGRREVRWTGTVTAWTDRFGACASIGARHGQIALVVAVEPVEPGIAMVEAWIELPERRQTVLELQSARGAVTYDGRLLHVDVRLDDQPVLVASVDVAADRLLYARSSLMQSSGLGVGALDPPTLQQASPARDAASA